MMAPLVSIVMPAFNSERYIQSAVASVTMQTLTNWELLIIDDCSSDRTYEIARNLSERDSRIHILRNTENLGAASSRNVAFSHCCGKYIALLDSDDLWYPNKLEKQVGFAEESHADIVCCSYAMIDEAGVKRNPDFIVPSHIDFESMLKCSTISCSTALIRREIATHYQFPTDMYHEDLAYWLLLLKNGATAIGMPEVLAAYRVTPGSRASNKLRSATNRWKIFRNYFHLPLCKSVSLLIQYTYLGLLKYRKTVG